MNDEEKYLEIREKLRSLETVHASSDFTNKLHLRIVEEESSRRKEHIKKFDAEKGGFLRNLFNNRQYPWLIPSVGFAVVIFFVFYITFISRDNFTNNENEISTDIKQETLNKDNTAELKKNTEQEKLQAELIEQDKEKVEEEKNGESSNENMNNEKKNGLTQNSDLAFSDNNKKRISPSETKTENETDKPTENKTIPELKKESETNVTADVKTEVAKGNEMATPKSRSKSDSEKIVIKRSKESISADESGDNGLSTKLDKINKAGLENIRNEIIK